MAAVDVGIIVTAVNNATAGIREIKGEVEGLGSSAQETANRLKAIQVVLVGIALDKIREMTKSFIETSANVQLLQTRLALINGDWKRAGEILDDVIERYDAVGVSGKAVAQVFLQLRGIGQTDEAATRLANAIAQVNAATDRSPASILSMGDAITKVLAKGTVDMRALVTVMAAQFPEAIRAAATAAGAQSVNTFVQLAKAGQITGAQFVEYFEKGVSEKFGGIFNVTGGSLQTALNRFGNIWEDSIRKLTLNTGVADTISQRLKLIRDSIDHLLESLKQEQIDSFFNALDSGGRILGGLIPPLLSVTKLVGTFAAVVGDVLAQVPGDVLAVGIIGYLVFGRAGAVAIITIGSMLAGLKTDLKTNFVGDIINFMGSSEALALGVIGYIMFGSLGSLALGVIGAKLASLRESTKQQLIHNGETVTPTLGATSAAQVYQDAANNVGVFITNLNKGKDVLALIKERAQEANLTVAQTAALIAHASRESDLGKRPVGDNGHSFGLFQFNDKGELSALQQFAEKAGKDWQDFGVQIDFVISRAQNGNDTFSKLWKSAASPAEASRALDFFERFKNYIAEGNVESAKRIAIAEQYSSTLEKIAAKPQAPVTKIDETLNIEQKTQLDALKVSAAEVNKQIEAIRTTLQDPSSQQAVSRVNEQFNQLKATLDKSIDDLQKFAGTLGDQPTAQKKVNEQLEIEKAKRDALIGLQTQQVIKEQNLANIQLSEAQVAQRILQMKADEAALNLKLNFSNNALFNAFAGTSAGQITIQVEQQKLQLQQQILSYMQQIDTLEQQKIKTNDPQLIAQIDTTISKYQQLTAATREALNGLSAQGLAARQMWNSVGNSIETGAVSAITTLVTHTGTLKDVQLQMYNAITQAAAKYVVQLLEIKAIMPLLDSFGMGKGFTGIFGGMFGGGGFANGGVFPGNVRPFASGGIIGGPTLFGLAGEAGTEAIMPLEQVGGKLGVRAVGAGGGDTHFHISAIDTQSGVEFLMKNVHVIQGALSQRKMLNRAGRTGG